MSIETIFSIGASIAIIFTAICGGIWFIISRFNAINGRFIALETKVEMVLNHMIRRAKSEGLNKGMLKQNSPIEATDEAIRQFEYAGELKQDLQKFCSTEGKNMKENELFLAVDEKFGERIKDEISKMYVIHYGSCLYAAIEIGKKKE